MQCDRDSLTLLVVVVVVHIFWNERNDDENQQGSEERDEESRFLVSRRGHSKEVNPRSQNDSPKVIIFFVGRRKEE